MAKPFLLSTRCLILLLWAEAGHGLGLDITAHRGASFDAPENTLAAFRLAWEKGADAIEGDFYLTRDGHIVCLHDATTERVAGQKLRVAESTLEALRALDVGSWKGKTWARERIPTLREVLATVPDLDKKIYIELKTGPEIVAPLKRDLAGSRLGAEQIRIICFNRETLAEVRKQLPELQTCWLSGYKENDRGDLTPTAEKVVEVLRELDVPGYGSKADRAVVNEAFMGVLRAHGIDDIHVWTVNDPRDAIYFRNLGVRGITTDRPALIRRAVEPARPALGLVSP